MKNVLTFTLFFLVFSSIANASEHKYAWQYEGESPEYCEKVFYFGDFILAKGFRSYSKKVRIKSALRRLEKKFLREKELCENEGGLFTYCPRASKRRDSSIKQTNAQRVVAFLRIDCEL